MKKVRIPALCVLLAFLLTVATWATESAQLMAVYSGECGATDDDHVTYTLDVSTGEAVISGTGAMSDYALEQYADKVKKVTVESGVTSVGAYAFRDCVMMEAAVLASSVRDIGENAFAGCERLKIITLNNGLSRVGEGAFASCEQLSRIELPDSVTEIGGGAFSGCYSLDNVNIPENVERIGDYAFQQCYNLSAIKIPDSVTLLGYYVFTECYKLQSAAFGSGISVMKSGMFEGCKNVETLIIPANVQVIENISQRDYSFCPNVYYAGSSSQWDSVSGNGKDYLSEYAASLHYEATGPDNPGTIEPLSFTIRNPSFGASIPLDITGGGSKTVSFFTAFYHDDGQFIGLDAIRENIFPGLKSAFVPVSQTFSPILRAFALDEQFKPLTPYADSENSGAGWPEKYAAIMNEFEENERNALIDGLTEQEAKDFVKRVTGLLH